MAFDVKQLTVGTTEVQLYSTLVRNVVSKITVKAAAGNAGKIWYGPIGVLTTTGYGELVASDEIEIAISRTDSRFPDETEYYFISDTAAQVLMVHAH